MEVVQLDAKIKDLRKNISPFSSDDRQMKETNESFMDDGLTIQKGLCFRAQGMARANAKSDLFSTTFSARGGRPLHVAHLVNQLLNVDRIGEAEFVMSSCTKFCEQNDGKIPVGCYKEFCTEAGKCLSDLMY